MQKSQLTIHLDNHQTFPLGCIPVSDLLSLHEVGNA